MAQENAACNNASSAPDNNSGGGAKKVEEVKPHAVQEQLPGVQYCIKSPPPWREALLLGFQHYLLTLGITVLIPTILVPQMGGGNAEKARVIQTLTFVSGISTFLQSLFGTRLPIVVVGSYTYIIPIMSIIQASRYNSYTDPYERFTQIMRGIQGALIITSCFQMTLGFFGLWRNAVRFLSPLCVAPYVTFTGLGLYRLGFPMYLNRYIGTKKPIFDRYSVLFTVSSAWLFALFLTSCTLYNHKPESTQNSCRTDRAGLMSAAPWVYFPRFFPWGSPTFNAGEAFAMMAASFVSLFEYTGTCYAVARYGSATPVPPSVISRGAGWMGVSTLLNGMFGSITGCTASVQIWSIFCFSTYANYSSIILCVIRLCVTKFVLGFSFFLGLSIPQYFTEYYHVKQHHGVPRWFNDVVTVIFMSHTTVAALVAFVLDVTLSREDDAARKAIGLQWWERFSLYSSYVKNDEFYSLPCKLDKYLG
ncbi:putative nucleobase-ascorbate transporter 10 [Glycine max]|nr:putative nucleobase-ascorbate transporter 10 [Glycine max]